MGLLGVEGKQDKVSSTVKKLSTTSLARCDVCGFENGQEWVIEGSGKLRQYIRRGFGSHISL